MDLEDITSDYYRIASTEVPYTRSLERVSSPALTPAVCVVFRRTVFVNTVLIYTIDM